MAYLYSKLEKNYRRKKKKKLRKTGWSRYYLTVVRRAKAKGLELTASDLPKFKVYQYRNISEQIPTYSDNISFLAKNPDAFSKSAITYPVDGVFKIPNPFSLTENYDESFLFLKRLFHTLYTESASIIKLDFIDCERMDVDASVCMDILLHEFISFFKKRKVNSFKCNVQKIIPVNYEKAAISKMLFSIGAYKTIKNLEISFPDIIPFPLIIGNNLSNGKTREIEVTKMVDYIVKCLAKMNRALNWEAENDLSKVIGEILINAAEHSGRKNHYAIGYFQETKNDSSHLGIFNLTIFAFGNTIYQTFKSPEKSDLEIVKRMAELSNKYTARKLFLPRQFEEETLWTLYALQEGVTSIRDKKRGNGSIHFIESFFRLKGDMERDNSSALTLISGNTRIIFDGTYNIVEKPRGKDGFVYKMMTFNDSGDIEDVPNKKFVNFAENFFPGTMISAKISIKFNNIEKGGCNE
jgi:hypothetical protein